MWTHSNNVSTSRDCESHYFQSIHIWWTHSKFDEASGCMFDWSLNLVNCGILITQLCLWKYSVKRGIWERRRKNRFSWLNFNAKIEMEDSMLKREKGVITLQWKTLYSLYPQRISMQLYSLAHLIRYFSFFHFSFFSFFFFALLWDVQGYNLDPEFVQLSEDNSTSPSEVNMG